MSTRQLGSRGEDLAARHLERAGWTVVNRNYRAGRHEIDLVARRNRVLAFIEVKTRRSERFGHPLAAIAEPKRAAIHRVAESWIERFGSRDLEYRFDAIAIVLGGGSGYRLQHVENAWGV